MSKSSRYERLKRLSKGPYPATTIRYARRYLADYPQTGTAWYMLAVALIESNRYEEAEQAVAKAIEFCPENKRQNPLACMGNIFEEMGDYDQAAEWFRKAIAADPDDAKYHIFLGAVLGQHGRLHDAEQSLRMAVACSDGPIDEAYFNLGLVLRSLECFQEAAECFREAVRIDPQYREASKALRDVELCMSLSHRRRTDKGDEPGRAGES